MYIYIYEYVYIYIYIYVYICYMILCTCRERERERDLSAASDAWSRACLTADVEGAAERAARTASLRQPLRLRLKVQGAN